MKKKQNISVVDNALDTLDVKQLRALVREIVPKLNDKTTKWLNKKLIARAIKNDPDWVPRPSERRVAEIEDIFAAAKANKKDDPKDVEIYRQEAIYAYEANDYKAASRIFAVLPVPLKPSEDGECNDFGDRYLELDLELHALHLISSYLGAEPEERPQAVFLALSSTLEFGFEMQPISNFEAEDMPGFDEFLVSWRAFLNERLASIDCEKSGDFPPEHYWFGEVVGIMDGPAGLAEIAKRTKSRYDLARWCLTLVRSEDWQAAADAYRESATLVLDPRESAYFLQRAAWIEAEFDDSSPDPPAKIAEQAWRTRPTFGRLVTWLRCAQTREELISVIAAVIPELKSGSELDGAFLLTLFGDPTYGSSILVAASQSRDWTIYEDFGDLLFPVFERLVSGSDFSTPLDSKRYADFNDLCALAEIKVDDADIRAVLLNDLRKAAENRIHVVAALAQRRRYHDTAQLAVRYVNITRSPEAKTWLRDLMEMYRRSFALIREINDVGAAVLLE